MSGASQSAIDRRFGEPSSPDNLRNGGASFPKPSDLFDFLGQEKGLAPELHASLLCLGDAVHLSLAADVILELGEKYSQPLERLQPGDQIVAYQKQAGYVGYGKVISPAVMAGDFQTAQGPLLDQPLAQPGLSHDRDDPKLAEHVVEVEWIKTMPIPDAKKFDGMFANQNIVCKLRDPETIEFLKEQFGVSLP